MPATELVYLVDITSGKITHLLAYLQAVVDYLGDPPELYQIFPRNFPFDFEYLRVPVQLVNRHPQPEEQKQRASVNDEPLPRDWDSVRGGGEDRDGKKRPVLQRAIILGDPGLGKSWLLRYEGFTIAKKEHARLQQGEIGSASVVVPLFAHLGTLAADLIRVSNLKEEKPTFVDLLKLDVKPRIPAELWELLVKKLEDGTVVLLLDGWDEVGVAPDELKELLKEFAEKFPHCRIYLTSRPSEYDETISLGDFTQVWKLVNFSSQQINKFTQRYFVGDEQQQAEGRAEADRRARTQKAFLKEIQASPQLQDLARTPLMLALLCHLYWESQDGTLPERRTEVYEKCLWGLLSEWQKEIPDRRKKSKTAVAQSLLLLSKLALVLFEGTPQVHAWKREELIPWLAKLLGVQEEDKAIVERLDELIADGVLVEEGRGDNPRLRFLHRTFQEYLAAQALADAVDQQGWDKATVQLDQSTYSVRTLVSRKAWDQGWHEVLIFFTGQLKDPTPFLAILRNPKPTKDYTNPYGDDLFRHRLALAALCLRDLSDEQRETHRDDVDGITTEVLAWWRKCDREDTLSLVPHLFPALSTLVQIGGRINGIPLLTVIEQLCHSKWAYQRNRGVRIAATLEQSATASLLRRLQELSRDTDRYVSGNARKAVLTFRLADRDYLASLQQRVSEMNATGPDASEQKEGDTTPDPLRRLGQLLLHEDAAVRMEVLEMIQAIGSQAATPAVRTVLGQLLLRENDPLLFAAVVDTVEALGPTAWTSEIRDYLAKRVSRDSVRLVLRKRVEAVFKPLADTIIVLGPGEKEKSYISDKALIGLATLDDRPTRFLNGLILAPLLVATKFTEVLQLGLRSLLPQFDQEIRLRRRISGWRSFAQIMISVGAYGIALFLAMRITIYTYVVEPSLFGFVFFSHLALHEVGRLTYYSSFALAWSPFLRALATLEHLAHIALPVLYPFLPYRYHYVWLGLWSLSFLMLDDEDETQLRQWSLNTKPRLFQILCHVTIGGLWVTSLTFGVGWGTQFDGLMNNWRALDDAITWDLFSHGHKPEKVQFIIPGQEKSKDETVIFEFPGSPSLDEKIAEQKRAHSYFSFLMYTAASLSWIQTALLLLPLLFSLSIPNVGAWLMTRVSPPHLRAFRRWGRAQIKNKDELAKLKTARAR